MDSLCPAQRLVADGLVERASSSAFPNAILLMGPAACGKRTVAQAVAEEMGLDFYELRLDQSDSEALSSLCGYRDSFGETPGALDRAAGEMLYLSGAHLMSEELAESLLALVRLGWLDHGGVRFQLDEATAPRVH